MVLKGVSMDIELPEKRNDCAIGNHKGNNWKYPWSEFRLQKVESVGWGIKIETHLNVRECYYVKTG